MNLTDEQLFVATNVDGPMIVSAGPGSGKTQTLVLRIAYILKNREVNPSEVLCLTFTNAGVRSMREKLYDLIGATAHKVGIYTFHSFADRIIEANPQLFGRKMLSPMDTLDKERLVRQVLTENPNLKFWRGPIYNEMIHVKNLISLFDIMQKENWSHETVRIACEKYIEELPYRSDMVYSRKSGIFNKGDLKQPLIDEHIYKMQRLMEGASLYDQYQQAKQDSALYDYSDAISYVIEAFNKHEHLKLDYAERYQYVLVDEFQDTNNSQAELIHSFATLYDEANVMIVGDADQAIFGFQGARIENISIFAEKQPNTYVVLLQQNFRSPKAVVDLANKFIQANQNRLNSIRNQDQEFKVSKNIFSEKEVDDCLEFASFQSPEHEAFYLAEQAQMVLEQGDTTVAILYRNHKSAAPIVKALEQKGIPYHIRKDSNALHVPTAQKLVSLIVAFAYSTSTRLEVTSTEQIHALLTMPAIGFTADEIIWLADAFHRNTHVNRSWSYFLAAGLLRTEESVPAQILEKHKKYQEILALVHTWQKKHYASEVVGYLTRASGLFSVAMESKDSALELAALKAIVEFAESRQSRKSNFTLRDLADDLQDLILLDIEIPVKSNQGSGVILSTVHNAKGEEFDYVYMAACTKRNWEDARTPPLGFTLPETLTFTNMEVEDVESERRLFYVGLTRAKEYLGISFSKYSSTGKDEQPSIFAAECMEICDMAAREIEMDVDLAFESYQTPPAYEPDIALFRDKLETYDITPELVETWNNCQTTVYFQVTTALPQPLSPQRRISSAIHKAAEIIEREPEEVSKDKTFNLVNNSTTGLNVRDSKSYVDLLLTKLDKFKEKAIYVNEDNARYVIHAKHVSMIVNGIKFQTKVDVLDLRKEPSLIFRKLYKPSAVKLKANTPAGRKMLYAALAYQSEAEKFPKIFVQPYSDEDMLEVTFTDVEVQKAMERLTSTIEAMLTANEIEMCEDEGCMWCELRRQSFSLQEDNKHFLNEMNLADDPIR